MHFNTKFFQAAHFRNYHMTAPMMWCCHQIWNNLWYFPPCLAAVLSWGWLARHWTRQLLHRDTVSYYWFMCVLVCLFSGKPCQGSPFLWSPPTFGRPTDSMALSHWTVLSVCLKCSPLLWRPKQQYTVFKDRTSRMESLILWHIRQFDTSALLWMYIYIYIPYIGTDLCHRFSSQPPFSEQRNWQVCQGRHRSSDPPPVRW